MGRRRLSPCLPLAALLCGRLPAAPPATAPASPASEPAPVRWVKLHEQKPSDAVRFRRQGHGGACFDAARGRLILFGSDTHGRNWENSPLLFDVARRRWSRLYPADGPATYAVTPAGLPVAGPGKDHPWAMHTFGAVVLDPTRDEMIVASYPAHMVPGRFSSALRGLWSKVKTFPTWTLDLKTGRWRALACKPVHFFPYCAAWDSDRNVVLGYRPDGIYELSGRPRRWKRLARKVHLGGWHNNCVYDAHNKALVVFGNNKLRNDVEVYSPADGRHRLMPTPGRRPPKDQHNPMAYEPRLRRTVVVVDRAPGGAVGKEDNGTAETWLYDLAADAWTPVPTATLPFACGMNYNMVYDAERGRLLLVTGGYGRATAVWALGLTRG